MVPGPQRMIVHGPVRPDVDPELASVDPMAASEWFGYVPDLRERASVLAASLRARGSPQLAAIVEAVERDPRWGWLTIDVALFQPAAGDVSDGDLGLGVDQWLRLKGVRIVDLAEGRGGRCPQLL